MPTLPCSSSLQDKEIRFLRNVRNSLPKIAASRVANRKFYTNLMKRQVKLHFLRVNSYYFYRTEMTLRVSLQ